MDGGDEGVREIDDPLSDAISSSLEMLDMVSNERICSELSIILSGNRVNEIVAKMEDLGVLEHISGSLLRKSGFNLCNDLEVNLALLCWEFDGDGSRLRAVLRQELMLSNSVLDEVSFLHDCRNEMMETGEGHLRRFAAALPERRKSRVLEYLGALGRDVSAFSEALKIIGAPRAGLSPLVNGHDLSRETGLPPGPRLGMLKGWLYRRQVEDDLVTFDEVIRLLEEIDWEDSDPEEWKKMEWP